MAPTPVKFASVYDKHRPEGRQEVAQLHARVDSETGQGYVLFVCQHDPTGWNFLSKQHAIEFASVLLMLALGLPGDVPEGDCGVSVPPAQEVE